MSINASLQNGDFDDKKKPKMNDAGDKAGMDMLKAHTLKLKLPKTLIGHQIKLKRGVFQPYFHKICHYCIGDNEK